MNWASSPDINMDFARNPKCNQSPYQRSHIPPQKQSESLKKNLLALFPAEGRSRERERVSEQLLLLPLLLQSFSHGDSFSASLSSHFSTNILLLTLKHTLQVCNFPTPNALQPHWLNQATPSQNPPLTMRFQNFTNTIILLCLFFTVLEATKSLNLTLPHQHPSPDSVALDVLRTVNASLSRRQLGSSSSSSSSCRTGNPIDDCWRCSDSDWSSNRQRLADCVIGFGRGTMGGKNGKIYVVTDSSDNNPANPTPGTLRFGVIQEEPLWIVFASNMLIRLKQELIFSSYKTLDGRGSAVHITGNGCLTLQYVQHIIIHNIHIYDCKPSGGATVASSPTHAGKRGTSDGDGISIFGSQKIWIDHCSLSHCTDGLIDAVMGSTAITISNNYFTHHDEVMLLGHDDSYTPDTGMQVTIAFNHFGQGLVQRMPRCRRGYIHVVNNDFTTWKMYAIGGSGNPTINSQGNRYSAPSDPSAKEVTKRVDSKDDGEWASWNWRSEGDLMENGAFFVASGAAMSSLYSKASSVDPKAASSVDQLNRNAGVFGGPRDDEGQSGNSFSPYGGDGSYGGGSTDFGGTTRGSSSDDNNFFGMIFGSDASPPPRLTLLLLLFSLLMILDFSTSALLLW